MQHFNILSLDGGGIKGLYTLYVLNEIETTYCIPRGKLLSDYFDMICGTSVGSLIGIGISLKIPISKIINIFEKNAQEIFPDYKDRNCLLAPMYHFYYKINQFFGAKYETTIFKKIIEEICKNKTMKDLNNIVCIPSYCLTTSQNCVFKNKFTEYETQIEENNVLLVDVIMASCSAPTFFHPYKINDKYYVDGGIWANNPSMVGIIEALKYYVGKDKKYKKYSILSIGNLNSDIKVDNKKASNYFNLSNTKNLLYIILNANKDSINYYSDKLQYFEYENISIRIENSYFYPDFDNSSNEFIKKIKELALLDSKEIIRNNSLLFLFQNQ
jgi:patatin-like phospholipase/acyl hydrolase